MVLIALVTAAWAGAYDTLKLRDGADCAALGTGPEVRDELIALAEGDVAPAYVPIRAADCLVAGWAADPAVVERAKAWVVEARWAGLGLVVADAEENFSLEDAVAIARAAVAGGDGRVRERMIRRFLRSERIEVRRVVGGVDEGGGVR